LIFKKRTGGRYHFVSTITVPLVDLVVSVYSVLLETHHLTSDIQRRAKIVVLYEIHRKKLQ